jgi:hypothetical protein
MHIAVEVQQYSGPCLHKNGSVVQVYVSNTEQSISPMSISGLSTSFDMRSCCPCLAEQYVVHAYPGRIWEPAAGSQGIRDLAADYRDEANPALRSPELHQLNIWPGGFGWLSNTRPQENADNQ